MCVCVRIPACMRANLRIHFCRLFISLSLLLQVLVRQFGRAHPDRDTETAILEHLGLQGIAPRLLGKFEGGRVEQFLDAEHLSVQELQDPVILAKIFTLVARLHSLQDIPCHKDVSLFRHIRIMAQCARKCESGAQMFLDHVSVHHGLDSWDALDAEAELLIAHLMALESPPVFCHNDLQEGNILRDREGRLSLIDFEYASFNPRAFDFANFFCEMSIDNFADSAVVSFWLHFFLEIGLILILILFLRICVRRRMDTASRSIRQHFPLTQSWISSFEHISRLCTFHWTSSFEK
jgi:thiamine kinase-like enzyme